jgi:multidrug resistance efflux pump
MSKGITKKKILILIFFIILLIVWIFYNFIFYKKITTDAFINAPVMKVSSEISGEFILNDKIELGTILKNNQEIGSITSKVDNNIISNLRLQSYNLDNSIKNDQSMLVSLKNRLHFLEERYLKFNKTLIRQNNFDVTSKKNEKNILIKELNEKYFILEQSQIDKNRAFSLKKDGLYHDNAMIDYILKEKIASEKVKEFKDRIKEADLAIMAAKEGLQIESNRNLSDAYNNYINLTSEIDNIENNILELENKVNNNKLHLNKINLEVNRQYKNIIYSKLDGTVWNIIKQSGSTVSTGSELIEIADCSKITVDAFVSDWKVKSLKEKQEVKIKVFRDIILEGSILSIRRGTGRFTIGQYIVDAPSEIMRRELPVRISTVRIEIKKNNRLNDLKRKSFCGIGQDVEVYL